MHTVTLPAAVFLPHLPEGRHSRGCDDQLAQGTNSASQGPVVLVEEAQTLLECLQAHPGKMVLSETPWVLCQRSPAAGEHLGQAGCVQVIQPQAEPL